MNRKKALQELPKLSWEDLDWLEQQCRALKSRSDGPKVYRSNGDAAHRREAVASYVADSMSILDKHHPGWDESW